METRVGLPQFGHTSMTLETLSGASIVMMPPSSKEIEHIFNLRIQVECALAKEAMQQATAEDMDRLEQLAGDLADTRDADFFFHKDRDFHLQLYSLSRMHHLLAVDSHLLDYVEGFLNTRRYSPEDISLFIQQHKDILTAMREKDEEKLMEAMRRNILVGLELMQDEMKRLKRH